MCDRYYKELCSLEEALINRTARIVETTEEVSPSLVKPQKEAIGRILEEISNIHLQYESTLSILGPPIDIDHVNWVNNVDYQNAVKEGIKENQINYKELQESCNKLKIQCELYQNQIKHMLQEKNNVVVPKRISHKLSTTTPVTISYIPSLKINNNEENTDQFLNNKLLEAKQILRRKNEEIEQYQTMEKVLMDSLSKKSERIAELEKKVNSLSKEINIMKSAGLSSLPDDYDDNDESNGGGWFFGLFG